MHSLAALKLLALGLSMNWDAELQRLELLRAIGPEHAARLDIVYPDANPTILAEHAPRGGRRRHPLAAAADVPRGGSLDPDRRWHEQLVGRLRRAHRHRAGRFSATTRTWSPGCRRSGTRPTSRPARTSNRPGVTMPGMPFVIIGHNKRVAWGFTNSFADCQDLVIEEFDSPAGDRFRTERGFEPTRRLREIIHVKGSSDVLEEVVVTRHGPVVERIEDPERSIWRGLALQWTALQPGGAAEGLLRLQRAGDWKSFKEAFAPFDAPSQNVVYADVDGHIGYLLSGRIPVRKAKPSGLPVQGWTGDAVWTRYLTPGRGPAAVRPS